jgi:gustatory receptor
MNLKNDGSFHQAISRVLLMGNFLGFPICGVLSKNTSDLKFLWKSFRALYSLYLLAMSILFLICFICWMISQENPSLSNFVSLTTFIRNVLCLICFQKLAKAWPCLMHKWSLVEESLPMFYDSQKKNFLKTRIMIVHILVLSVSVGEFGESFFSFKLLYFQFNNLPVENILQTTLAIRSASKCRSESGLKAYLIVSHPEIFQIIGDNMALGIFAKITSFMLSLMGSYRDLFVMCISLALSTRFQQVNKILLDHKGKSMLPSCFWSEHRQYHRKLAGLVNDVDITINNITLLALSNNLFFICTSLLNSL